MARPQGDGPLSHTPTSFFIRIAGLFYSPADRKPALQITLWRDTTPPPPRGHVSSPAADKSVPFLRRSTAIREVMVPSMGGYCIQYRVGIAYRESLLPLDRHRLCISPKKIQPLRATGLLIYRSWFATRLNQASFNEKTDTRDSMYIRLSNYDSNGRGKLFYLYIE